ncbi:BglG family transcription antiterminator [Anaeromicropila herbilytica]|uniref:PTS fructose transporter subunit IIA n=1 Tax=Anaeromicropila herbilytica TaxID=2785025 RepID=A0A7R7IEI2_9FIRM|nr:PTS sugar transporter subunit IIA [Anaeromicropila herbilytica]BCN31133.1 PTS fructose transporter subunit IIA [Anaeromicropila herbilytica]
MERRLWEIIDELSESEFKTSASLGEVLGASEKTIRTRIKELNEEIRMHGAEVYSKPRYGYYLRINEPGVWMDFLNSRGKEELRTPTDSKERTHYLLVLFLSRKDYIKIEELSSFLYVSTKTLSNELKKVEYILNRFHIELERKPYYGIRAIGKEFNMRICILHNQLMNTNPFFEVRKEKEKEIELIGEALLHLSKEYGVRFAETAFQNTVIYIYISISRMKKGFYIPKEALKVEESDKRELLIAERIYTKLKEVETFEITKEEIYYTGIYIAGKSHMGDINTKPNFVISEKTDKLVSQMLEEIYLTYNVELRDDLNLRMMLNQHLIPMEIRIKYNIPFEYFVEDELKEKNFFSYTMAQQAGVVLEKAYNKNIADDEIACLALYFQLAMEEKKTSFKRKNNILLVCISGKASSQMLMYRFRQEFGEYINTIKVCGMYDFEQCDLSDVDFIFSTVPIYSKVTVPIMEIKDFLESNEIMAVRRFLQVGDFRFLQNYYQPKYFFTDIHKSTKEEILHEMCLRIKKVTEVPDNFEASILERESFGPTDFGNLVAIPHPCQILTKETIVAVAVLNEEVLWSSHMVRVVILTSLSEEKTEDTQKFYDVTTKFLMDKSTVMQLLELPDFNHFIKLLCEVGIKK